MSDSKPRKRSIALLGFRGSGKTTVGRELAARYGGACVDTDETITARTGKSIATIFAEEGEGGFRRREHEAITRVVSAAPTVISVGGGAILDDRNVAALKTIASLVWLRAPAEVLWERISADPASADRRPALTGQPGFEEVARILAERQPHYERAADIIVDSSRGSPEEIAAEIATQLGQAWQP